MPRKREGLRQLQSPCLILALRRSCKPSWDCCRVHQGLGTRQRVLFSHDRSSQAINNALVRACVWMTDEKVIVPIKSFTLANSSLNVISYMASVVWPPQGFSAWELDYSGFAVAVDIHPSAKVDRVRHHCVLHFTVTLGCWHPVLVKSSCNGQREWRIVSLPRRMEEV